MSPRLRSGSRTAIHARLDHFAQQDPQCTDEDESWDCFYNAKGKSNPPSVWDSGGGGDGDDGDPDGDPDDGGSDGGSGSGSGEGGGDGGGGSLGGGGSKPPSTSESAPARTRPADPAARTPARAPIPAADDAGAVGFFATNFSSVVVATLILGTMGSSLGAVLWCRRRMAAGESVRFQRTASEDADAEFSVEMERMRIT